MGKVLVSFKQKERELENLVNSKGDKSNFIKDALKFYLEHSRENIKTPARPEVEENGMLDILESI